MHPARDITHAPYALQYDRLGDGALVVRLAGSWKLEDGLPVHVIATSGGWDQQAQQWIHLDYVPYSMLRKKW